MLLGKIIKHIAFLNSTWCTCSLWLWLWGAQTVLRLLWYWSLTGGGHIMVRWFIWWVLQHKCRLASTRHSTSDVGHPVKVNRWHTDGFAEKCGVVKQHQLSPPVPHALTALGLGGIWHWWQCLEVEQWCVKIWTQFYKIQRWPRLRCQTSIWWKNYIYIIIILYTKYILLDNWLLSHANGTHTDTKLCIILCTHVDWSNCPQNGNYKHNRQSITTISIRLKSQ